MKLQRLLFVILGLCIGSAATQVGSNAADDVATVRRAADGWRREHRLIDLHQHIDCTPERLVRAAQIVDRVGIGIAVNLSGGTTTHQESRDRTASGDDVRLRPLRQQCGRHRLGGWSL